MDAGAFLWGTALLIYRGVATEFATSSTLETCFQKYKGVFTHANRQIAERYSPSCK